MKIKELGKGFMHKTYLADIDGDKYVMQKLGKTFGSIPDITNISEELNKRHFPTVEVLPNWRVTKHIEGECIENPNDKQFKSALRLALTFHAVTRDIKVPTNNEIHSVPELRGLYDTINELPHRTVHGDLKPFNFIFKDDVAVALIDLDLVHSAPIVWDIANMICSWCNIDGEINYDRVEMIKCTYLNSDVCSKEEFEMIDFTVLAFSLEFYYRYQDYDYFSNLEKSYCDMRVKSAMKFYNNYKKYTEKQ